MANEEKAIEFFEKSSEYSEKANRDEFLTATDGYYETHSLVIAKAILYALWAIFWKMKQDK